MSEQEQEQEIQARVEFKMNEFLTGLKNRLSMKYAIAVNNPSPKHCLIWEAFDEVSNMVRKETKMATPSNEMAQERKRKLKDRAVDQIVKSTNLKESGNYHKYIGCIVRSVEEAQNW